MDLHQIDKKLNGLREAIDRIGGNLLDLELDPSRRLLDESELEGASGERWGAASAQLIQLWRWHGALTALLEQAEQLRGDRGRLRPERLRELEELLVGTSIEAPGDHVPIEKRELLEQSQATIRCTPDQLLEIMSQSFDEARAALVEIGTAWDTFVVRLRGARASIEESAERCLRLDQPEPPELARAQDEFNRLSRLLASDPLAVSADEVDALEASAAALSGGLDAAVGLSADMGNRLAEARALLGDLRRAGQESQTAYEQALLKIGSVTVPEPVSLAGIEVELERVVELCDAGDWRAAADVLDRWTAHAGRVLADVRKCTAECRAPIEARNELRGRLEAYRGKANALGLLEDPELSSIFRRARQALHTAPCDLEQAEHLVQVYQLGLRGGLPSREAAR